MIKRKLLVVPLISITIIPRSNLILIPSPTQLMPLKETIWKNLNSVNVRLTSSAKAHLSVLIIWIPLPAEVWGSNFNNSSFLLLLLSADDRKKKQKMQTVLSFSQPVQSRLNWAGVTLLLVTKMSWCWTSSGGVWHDWLRACDLFFFLFFSFFKVTSFKN